MGDLSGDRPHVPKASAAQPNGCVKVAGTCVQSGSAPTINTRWRWVRGHAMSQGGLPATGKLWARWVAPGR
ncbi:hypothetical protein VF13_37020 [Nostoc linckia z16]|nr:hypothetical protein VF12_39545 [Nostoc linckia z15]PHK36509.1 hypothetical protein VF13_37020 [Nostoc linckia z16]